MNNKIYFSKLNEFAIIPSKRDEDAAYDIYPCFDEEFILINPHETKMINTKIASAFSSDYVALLRERGSTGTKGMGQRAGVIDSGYRGEWLVPITNHNSEVLVIAKKEVAKHFETAVVYPYEKAIAQCLMVEVPKFEIEEISYEELLEFTSLRGAGRLGSSGK